MINAFKMGYTDGRAEPDFLSMGRSYDSRAMCEAYDMGANIGQIVGRLLGPK